MIEISKRFRFEAAHRLDRLPPSHKCHNLHGHSYEFVIHVSGQIDQDIGWVVDYADISAAVKPLVEKLDHAYLNDVLPDISTAENLAIYIYIALKAKLAGLSAVEVRETPTTNVIYRPA